MSNCTIAMMQDSPVGTAAEEIILRLLYQLLVILVTTRVVVWIAKRFLGQTEVSGEILAGLILGPSVLGAVAPELLNHLFHPSTATVFTALAQIGLVLLMFQIGLEFHFKTNISGAFVPVLFISITAIVAPFVLAYFTAPWFYSRLPPPLPPEPAFKLFFATAMSITAIPILGRIFLELGLSHTRTAAVTIAAAAIDDVCGWLLLGVIASIVTAQFLLLPFLQNIALLSIYLAAAFYIFRPVLQRRIAADLAKNSFLTNRMIGYMLIVLFLSASITSNLGIFAIIGGFVIGVILHENRTFASQWSMRVSPLVQTFFLPVFFTYTGLRTDITALTTPGLWMQTALVCLVAFAGKFGGAFLASRLAGENMRNALTIGIAMNTRGLMGLIAIHVGYDLGVIPGQMFTMLVILAIFSTYIATPLIGRLMAEERTAIS